MAQNHVFIKETLRDGGKEMEAYSTLTGVLKSESIYHMARTIRYFMNKQNIFQIGNLIIRKVKLNSGKHEK